MTEARKTCCICGAEITGYGNNPDPLEYPKGAVCCDRCNLSTVIPARIKQAQAGRENSTGGGAKE